MVTLQAHDSTHIMKERGNVVKSSFAASHSVLTGELIIEGPCQPGHVQGVLFIEKELPPQEQGVIDHPRIGLPMDALFFQQVVYNAFSHTASWNNDFCRTQSVGQV
jgi:hypothetical protein